MGKVVTLKTLATQVKRLTEENEALKAAAAAKPKKPFANRSDLTVGNLRKEGPYENNRNTENEPLLEAVLAEAFGTKKIIIAHHITYKADGFYVDEETGSKEDVEVIEEIPAIDTAWFDANEAGTGIAQKIWGSKITEMPSMIVPKWQAVLIQLAMCPVETRDALAEKLYLNRPGKKVAPGLVKAIAKKRARLKARAKAA